MKTLLIALAILVFPLAAFSQQDEPRTIRFKKESNLAKAVFDNTRLQLVVMDKYGNPRDNRVLSYKLYVKTKRETREFEGFSNELTGEMVNFLNKQKKAVKIFFTEVKVRDDGGHLLPLPDVIDVWFPDCGNCQ
jgi:hypothetical protein